MERDETVTIESIGRDGPSIVIDRPTSYNITTDITTPSEACVEIGDNGTWRALRDAIAIGRKFRVAINGRSILQGRCLMRSLPISADAGATVQLTVRTVLADAAFTSCKPFNVSKATLKDVVLRAYATIGLTEDDFIFNADLARDILTGRGRNTSSKVVLEKMTEQEARVQPPETVWSVADRHLRRFGLLQWDGPDGRIVIGKPNDTQSPIYALQCLRDTPRGNNLLGAQRNQDYEQVPTSIAIYGRGGKQAYGRAPVNASINNTVLAKVAKLRAEAAKKTLTAQEKQYLQIAIDGEMAAYIPPPITSTLKAALDARVGINRGVAIIDESITTQALAEARARREMAMRSLASDSWDVRVRNWCYSDSNRKLVPWAVDTCSSLAIDTADPVTDSFYVWRVRRMGSPTGGHETMLTLSAKGVWVI